MSMTLSSDIIPLYGFAIFVVVVDFFMIIFKFQS